MRTYDLGIMKLFSFKTQMEQLKGSLISRYFFSIFFGNIFLTKFLLKLPSNPSCIYEFYKGRLQSLKKKVSTVA